MIYTKKANFPYPLLTNDADDYTDGVFTFNADLKANTENYVFQFSYEISSEFIKQQLAEQTAHLVIVIKSKDNQFHVLNYEEKPKLELPKCKLVLSTKTVMQLLIIADKDISFSDNNDINSFYDALRSNIVVKKGNVLAISDTLVFDGEQSKPYELFERKVDPTLPCEIDIKLSPETIVIYYKKTEYEFNDLPDGCYYNYPQIARGLERALVTFLEHYANNLEEGLVLNEMDEIPENVLDRKLFTLLQDKGIDELRLDNIDEVIYRITDKLMGKYNDAIRRAVNVN